MPEPSPQELIAYTRTINGKTPMNQGRWTALQLLNLLADALEASEFERRRERNALRAGWTWGQYELALSQEIEIDEDL